MTSSSNAPWKVRHPYTMCKSKTDCRCRSPTAWVKKPRKTFRIENLYNRKSSTSPKSSLLNQSPIKTQNRGSFNKSGTKYGSAQSANISNILCFMLYFWIFTSKCGAPRIAHKKYVIIYFWNKIKASEMLVAPRISEYFLKF